MNDLTVAVIDRAIELAPAKTLSIDSFVYIDKDKGVTLHKPPVPKPLEISKLGGFIDLLEADFEKFPVEDTLIHVVSHTRVELIGRESDKYGRRQVYIAVELLKPEREFQFNSYIGQENFVIALRSLFIQDSQLDDVVRIAGNLAAKSEMQQQDDGFTQKVTVKAGVVMVEEKTILPRCKLAPYRTFREVTQPSSEFIFRVKGDDRGNHCALFEADGGTWKLESIDNIKAWIENQLKGSESVGLSDIPIIA